ncbi:MAG: serine hydroxymethyltransferase [Candidatus Woesearchaeota archaeon]|nr:serine hydroxymethyltransferase [Candidatus Woesearchaeota archaeon]
MSLHVQDPAVHKIIQEELHRQQTTVNLIASENYASEAVMEATGSVLTNKYSEGYPKKRYYQGNANADDIELLAIERAKELFGAAHANVQALSGSPANAAIFGAFLEPGDTFLGFTLTGGGHLTHGSHVNFSGKIYSPVHYEVDKETGLIDMEAVRALAKEHKPKMIISGFTAYTRVVDFKAFQEIAEEVGAIHLADISHIGGLVAGGVHPSPFPFTDVVMTTTHKTLRGPRGALIMCKEEHAKAIDKAIFPGYQGGPHDNVTAAKAVAFGEALKPEFKAYSAQIVKNAQALAKSLKDNGIKILTDGTDNHMVILDLCPIGVSLGRPGAVALENAGIITNCNTVPFEPGSPFKPSGIRIGTAMMTTRGMREPEMEQIGKWMASILQDMDNTALQAQVKGEVAALCTRFPVYEGLG